VLVVKNLFLVMTNPVEGQDDAFNEWYDTQHVREVLALPGVVAAQRYELSEVTVPEEDMPAPMLPPAHRYLVIYELDREPDQVMAEWLKGLAAGTLTVSETLDLNTVSVAGWTPRGARTEADS